MKKHSVRIAGHPTSISLEEPFWNKLNEIAATQDISLGALITQIDAQRGDANLSSALRVYILRQMEDTLTALAGHPQERL